MASESGLNGDGNIVEDVSETKRSREEDKEVKKTEKKEEHEKTKTVPFYKLFAFADSFDILLMILGTLGSIGNGLGFPIMTVLFGDLIDAFGQNQNDSNVSDKVSKVALKFVWLGIGTFAAAFLQLSGWMISGERQAARIRSMYLKTILRQDIAFFDVDTNTGEVVGRMSGDTVLIQDAMGEKVGKAIQLLSTFVGGFVIAFLKGWLLTLVMLSSIPLLVMAGAGLAIVIAKTASRGQTAYANAAVVVEQTIGSIRTVASFTGEKQAINNYNKHLLTAYKAGVIEGGSTGLGLGTLFLVIFCSYALAVWYGGKLILDKGYTGGQVLNIIISVLTGSMSLGQASPCLSAFAAGQAAAYKMFETIERRPDIDSYSTNGKVLDDIKGDIELKDVYFTYPARPDEQIFRGFSLFISSGTTVALVGQSGSGKSTVVSLIERFYDPQAGEIIIDGVNLKEFQLKWIRSKIGLVSQEPVLFTSSIKDNIAYGKEDATIEEIKAAAELANASKFVDKLPQGLDTMVGEHGTQLSGGQKQRIAVARAILKDPRILLLDEATSALDAESERVVQEALDRIMVNRTTVVVAHRLSTVRNADMIAVIHQGKIVEKGSHTELLKDPEGAYSQLIRLQEEKKGEENPTDEQKIKSSLGRSLSKGGSSRGNSSRHSFNMFGFPSGVEGNDVTQDQEEAYPAQTFFFAIAGCKLVKRIRSMCFEKVVHMEVGWFDESEHSSGTIGARLSADAAAIRGLVGDALAQMVQNLSSILAGLIIAFLACWQLAFVVLAMLPLIALNGFLYMKFMQGFSADAKKMYGEASQVANDAVGSIRTVASFCAEEKVMNMYTKKCEGPMKTGIRQGIVSGIGFGFSFFVLFASYACSFYVGARLVDDGKTTFDSVFRVFFALTMAAMAISQSSSLSPDSSKADIAAASIFAIIDRESKIDPSVESGRVLDTVKGDIELRHVSFKYPARPNVQIFQDLCLSIRAGKTVALVGESGSGKSTVIALLQRFYDPDSGEITLDGVEIKSLRLKWLRQQTGLVSQEPILFNETIRANIAYGKGGDASESEIVSAAELSNAHGFISGLQQGYDTMVGERGIQLSGGQKQRVAIARAIVKDPKVLLLDEATSALDAESERVVQDALDRVMVNRTTIVVAHRLSTIKNADVIAVVKNGVIVEKGKHESLINIKDGVYASLVQLHLSAAS
ncbi:BnaA04g26870D [Brassica napus]|uniref:BnaA04g26870D protein n=1 Tax=Brassica napus TaxID=3708 RepID=A0A078IFQ8_BRANA|nr:BnaA04g26870D [Brassica napus]